MLIDGIDAWAPRLPIKRVLVDLLDEAKSRCKTAILERDTAKDWSEEEIEKTSEAIGDKGNTAVYLLYAHARICSIIRKSGRDMEEVKRNGKIVLDHEDERLLGLHLLQFLELWPEIIAKGGTPVCRARCVPQLGKGLGLSFTMLLIAQLGRDWIYSQNIMLMQLVVILFSFCLIVQMILRPSTEYGLIPMKEEPILPIGYNRSLHEDSNLPAKAVYPPTGGPTSVHSVPPDYAPNSTVTGSQVGVALTPKLIATLASFLPATTQSSVMAPSQQTIKLTTKSPESTSTDGQRSRSGVQHGKPINGRLKRPIRSSTRKVRQRTAEKADPGLDTESPSTDGRRGRSGV
ncbi:Arginine--tRNA ligase, chloroplastic/mitochondrial, partial [Mucuna pruriens]